MSFGPQDLTYCELFLSLNTSQSIAHIEGWLQTLDPDDNKPPAAASLRDKNVWPKFKLCVNTKCCLRGPETWSQDEQPVKIIHNWGNHVNQIWPRDTRGWGVHTWPIVQRPVPRPRGQWSAASPVDTGHLQRGAGRPPSQGSACLVSSHLTDSDANTSSSLKQWLQRISNELFDNLMDRGYLCPCSYYHSKSLSDIWLRIQCVGARI